jgi:hypothetical protein
MSRLGSPFIREINLAIVGLAAVTVVAAAAHYVSVVHEIHRVRQELCSARLELITTRNRYLKTAVEPPETCAALATLTGDHPVGPARVSSRPFSTLAPLATVASPRTPQPVKTILFERAPRRLP